MLRRWLVPLGAGLGVHLFLLVGRSYPWQLASMAALAVTALVYSTQRTLELRFWSRRAWEVEHSKPGQEEEGPRGTTDVEGGQTPNRSDPAGSED